MSNSPTNNHQEHIWIENVGFTSCLGEVENIQCGTAEGGVLLPKCYEGLLLDFCLCQDIKVSDQGTETILWIGCCQ